MLYPSYQDQKEKFLDIIKPNYDKINISLDEPEKVKEYIRKMNVKIKHSYDMAIDGFEVSKSLDLFSNELVLVQQTVGLLHDIGRFEQMANTHTFIDNDSFYKDKKTIYRGNVKDHGELGQYILINDQKITDFFRNNRDYDLLIGEVVGKHVSMRNHYHINDKITEFKNYSVKEILTNPKLIQTLISWQTQIVQETDRLDILKQVLRGDFNPGFDVNPEKSISQDAYNKFYNCEFINMNELRNNNLWTKNTGNLIRWSFIYQTKLVSTLMRIKDSHLLEDIWTKNPIPEVEEAYQYILVLRDALIDSSEDGINTNLEQAKLYVKR